MMSPMSMNFGNMYSSGEFDLNKEKNITLKASKSKVFNYEGGNQDKGQTIDHVPIKGINLMPEKSLYSPTRPQDFRKDLHGEQNIALLSSTSNQGMKISADPIVKGRRINMNEVDVKCAVSASDSYRMKQMGANNREMGKSENNYFVDSQRVSTLDERNQHIVNINTQNVNAGFFQSQQFVSGLGGINNPQSLTKQKGREGSQEHQKRMRSSSNSNIGSHLRQRKGSNDSHKSSSGRNQQQSQGRNNNNNLQHQERNSKSIKTQSSNSQSASRKKHSENNATSPSPAGTTGASSKQFQFGNKLQQKDMGKGLKRPNSAAILNQDPSASNFKTMVTSPSVNVLSREPSQQFLPPKPKVPQRNQTFAKLPQTMYQSVENHPLGSSSSAASVTQSIQKRVPSASSERPTVQRLNTQIQKSNQILDYQQPDHGQNIKQDQVDINTFSPLRRGKGGLDNFQTNPSSNHKLGQSRGKSKQRHQNSSVKRKKNTNQKQKIQSPNIERIRPERVIKEENKEEEDTQREQQLDNNAKGEVVIKNQSLNESEIKKQENAFNKENEGSDSQNSSLSFKQQTRILLKAQSFKDIELKIQKDLTQKLQQKKSIEEKKEKLFKENEQQRKNYQEMLKQTMNKKLQENKAIIPKRKQQQQQMELKEQVEILKKKMEKKEQYLKEKEERQEIIEIFQTMKVMQPMSSTSNSQTRKRGELSKSQQRPFSAKNIEQQQQQQQLLIKVPPVQVETNQSSNVYDVVAVQEPRYHQPFSEQHINNNNRIVSFQEISKKKAEEGLSNEELNEFIKKQKKERSKKRKTVENQEQYKKFKKEKDLQTLQEKYNLKFEQFKVKQIQQFKGRLALEQKKHNKKNVQQQQEENFILVQQQQQQQLMKKGRSKSKRRVDEEKENRQGSVSPQRVRSGTKSRSEKKRRKKHQQQQLSSQENSQIPSMASIQKLSYNVMELLEQQRNQTMNKNKAQVLQTIQLQRARDGNNIQIQKKNLKQLQDKQIVMSSKQEENNSQLNQEMSFNQNKEKFYQTQELQNTSELERQLTQTNKQAFNNEQLSNQMTPVIIQKKKINILQQPQMSSQNSQLVLIGRPSDSVKSVDMASNLITPGQNKSCKEWMKQTQSKLEEIQRLEEEKVIKSKETTQQRRSRSQSQEDFNKGQQENLGQLIYKVNVLTNTKEEVVVQSPQKKQHQEIEEQEQQYQQKQGGGTKSGSKKKNSSQKKNKKYKRNNLAKGLPQQNMQVILQSVQGPTIKEQQYQQVQRPKSAANPQQMALIEMIQQQKKQKKNQQAVVMIQSQLRRYLALKKVKQMREEKQLEQNYQSIKENYYKNQQQEQKDQKSPIRNLIEEKGLSSQQKQVAQTPLQEQSQVEKSKEENKENNISQSQLSRSQASLQTLLAQEEQKQKKKKRPNSSEVGKQEEQDNLIKQYSNKVAERISYQNKINQKVEQQNKMIKGQVNLDSASSQVPSNRVEEQQKPGGIKENQKSSLNIRKGFQEKKRSIEGIVDSEISESQNANKKPKINNMEEEIESLTQHEESKKDSLQEELSNLNKEQQKIKVQQHSLLLDQQQLNRMNYPGQRKREGWTSNKKQSDQSQNQFFQKLSNGNNHNNEVHSQLLSAIPQFNINTVTSEDKDQSWQFDRRSFQDFYDQNSKKEQVVEGGVDQQQKSLQGSGQKQKTNLSRKILQYEEMLDVLQKNHEKEKHELQKLQQRAFLSPKSMKKKLQLERWVTKQEEQLKRQKKLFKQNVNEMISKIDKDLQQTKKRIGSKKKGNQLFNNSVEWSHDISIGQVNNSSSVHSTPRISKPSSISGLNSISQTERNQKRAPFEYKMPSQQELQQQILQQMQSQRDKNNDPSNQLLQQTLHSAKSSEPIQPGEHKGVDVFYQQNQLQEDSTPQSILQVGDEDEQIMFVASFKDKKNNVFAHNLASEEEEEMQSNNVSEDPIQVEDIDGKVENDQTLQQNNQSLSKIEHIQFQSPTLSAISPSQQQLKDYYNDEEFKQNAPFGDTFDQTTDGKNDTTKELIISTLSPDQQTWQQQQHHSQSNLKEEIEPIKPQSEMIDHREEFKQEHEQLADAFLALKEPEQPISFKEANEMREQREQEKEQEGEDLTNYILMLLLEQTKSNLFPKRVIVQTLKTPQKGEDLSSSLQQHSPSEETSPSSLILDNNVVSIAATSNEVIEVKKIEEQIKSESDQSLQNEKNSLKEKILALKEEKKKQKRIRGIKTTLKIVDTYLNEVFKKVKDQEDEFVENLSSPLHKDPLDILLHLQNVCLDQEYENAVAFQQSVLPVDLYLDIERNKQKVQILESPLMDGFEFDETDNKSMLAEWENIHNKVIFDAINEALDNYRPYGLRGPPMPWSQQTRTLTYKNGQQIDTVLKSVKQKVIEWGRTFAGALPCSELLLEYGIKGPLDEDKLNLLREERLALVLASEIEENEILWTDYEYEETQTKLDIADMILEVLAEETIKELDKIKGSRQPQISTLSTSLEQDKQNHNNQEEQNNQQQEQQQQED